MSRYDLSDFEWRNYGDSLLIAGFGPRFPGRSVLPEEVETGAMIIVAKERPLAPASPPLGDMVDEARDDDTGDTSHAQAAEGSG